LSLMGLHLRFSWLEFCEMVLSSYWNVSIDGVSVETFFYSQYKMNLLPSILY